MCTLLRAVLVNNTKSSTGSLQHSGQGWAQLERVRLVTGSPPSCTGCRGKKMGGGGVGGGNWGPKPVDLARLTEKLHQSARKLGERMTRAGGPQAPPHRRKLGPLFQVRSWEGKCRRNKGGLVNVQYHGRAGRASGAAGARRQREGWCRAPWPAVLMCFALLAGHGSGDKRASKLTGPRPRSSPA